MKLIELNNITYGFAIDFKEDEQLRASYNKLTEAIFGFNLENWYQNGFWADNYIPYSLIHNNEVVSNISVNKMEFEFEKKRKTAIQIGTVMTHKKYRNRGLNKFILEQVINEWKDKCDFIYLFANDSVFDFYPKFNFERVDEYQYSKSVSTDTTPSFKKLNMEDKSDVAFLMETINMSIPISKVSMRNNVSLLLFYCLSFKKNSIFYIDELEAIVIMDIEGDTLNLNDVFTKNPLVLDELIQLISGETIRNVKLGFTPLNTMGFNRNLVKEGDTLFILKDKIKYFKENHWMFPVLSHA